jgi:hypothetical protein
VARGDRVKRHLHALNADGMLVCNPRDKEAAHRAQVEGIATENSAAVTCKKCRSLISGSRRPDLDGVELSVTAGPRSYSWSPVSDRHF